MIENDDMNKSTITYIDLFICMPTYKMGCVSRHMHLVEVHVA